MKVVINGCYGGFSLNEKGAKLYQERSENEEEVWYWEIKRHDPILVELVEEFGNEIAGSSSKLLVEEIDDRYDYWISEYDGIETIHLKIREDELRKLIREGNEDDIVDYVLMK